MSNRFTQAASAALPVLSTVLLLACSMAGSRSPAPSPTLIARRDSFIVRVRGRDAGFQVHALEPTADGWRFTDITRIANGPDQLTTVQTDASGAVRSMHQRLAIGTMVAESDLTYGNGRIKGMIRLPQPTGKVTDLPIDTVAVAGIVDDNFYAALIPALPWAPAASITLPVFVGGKNETQQWKFTVQGTESVTVPSGTFDAYRIGVEGAPSRLTTYVEVAAPHRVLKVTAAGAPFEVLRAN
ncbi:MAG: hypothetical protein JWM95_4856 [Gemmatimonadetes bacterium]|nr:hypothetical protein [Gemmatimonadota bacterium]